MKSINILKLVVCIVVCELAGIIGALVTSARSPWYQNLIKPSFNPPSWVFGPVWTTLYVMMGIAAYLVWKKGSLHPGVRGAMIVFGIQLFLNSLWSPTFFGAHEVGWALAIIVALWLAIVWTILKFRKISLAAAALLIPYLLWVSFATVLNYSIWTLN